jgi:hypothetical protein
MHIAFQLRFYQREGDGVYVSWGIQNLHAIHTLMFHAQIHHITSLKCHNHTMGITLNKD